MTCRWLKYEETVEVGERWSKPHVSTISMHGLLDLKRALIAGSCVVGLGVQSSANETIAGNSPLHLFKPVTGGSVDRTVALLVICAGNIKKSSRETSLASSRL